MEIEQLVNSRLQPCELQELHLELISDLRAFMEGEFDIDSAPEPEFHARSRELEGRDEAALAPAPADLQVALKRCIRVRACAFDG